MFEQLTVGYILAGVMAMIGDILALIALGNAGFALLGALLGFSRRKMARPLSGSIAATVITGIALAAKFLSPEIAGMPNGFVFAFSNVAVVAALFGAALLTIGALTLMALRGTLVR